jgi:hypothetical protein
MYTYKNLQAITICPGDLLAFDLIYPNEMRPAFASISFSSTTVENYQVVVEDSEASSAGNNVVGDFETQFTINHHYVLAGGGLIIRFKMGGIAATSNGFVNDQSYNGYVRTAQSSDTSGYFFSDI